MRLNLLYIIIIVFSSCSSTNQENNQEKNEIGATQLKANWQQDKEKVLRIIDKHFMDNTLRKGVRYAIFLDKVSDAKRSYFINYVHQDSIYPLDDTRTFMKVSATSFTSSKDSLIFDYQVTLKNKPTQEGKDSLYYEVTDVSLRKFNNDQRYVLKKEGNYWTKEILVNQ
jgi:hypothetical protein